LVFQVFEETAFVQSNVPCFGFECHIWPPLAPLALQTPILYHGFFTAQDLGLPRQTKGESSKSASNARARIGHVFHGLKKTLDRFWGKSHLPKILSRLLWSRRYWLLNPDGQGVRGKILRDFRPPYLRICSSELAPWQKQKFWSDRKDVQDTAFL